MTEDTKARFEHWADSTFDRVGSWLYIVTRGRLSGVLAHRRTLLLRTRGRRTGRPRTVVLQYFPDGDDVLVVAANAGLPQNPDWYHNLLADPNPSVLVEGRALHVTPVSAQRMAATSSGRRCCPTPPTTRSSCAGRPGRSRSSASPRPNLPIES